MAFGLYSSYVARALEPVEDRGEEAVQVSMANSPKANQRQLEENETV